MFCDGNLRVDNFSKKCFTNVEVAFLEITLGKSVYLLFCISIYRRPNTNIRVFISELTSSIEQKVLLFKNLLIVDDFNISMLLSNDASRNWISVLDEFGLQQQVALPTHKSGGIFDQVTTSEEVEVSEPLVSFVISSNHRVVHFDFLQKHENLAIKNASSRKWQNFDVVVFAESIIAPIDRDNRENFWNNVLLHEIGYVDKNHPLKTKYVRNHTCPFFDDELRTVKTSRRKFEKAFRKNGNSQVKIRFLNAVLRYFELIAKKRSEYLAKCVASENKSVRYSMLQQILGKNIIVLPQSLGELECQANKFNALFFKKIEAFLVSLPPTKGLELTDSHTPTLESFQVFTLIKLQLLLPKISNTTASTDVIPTRLCKIVLTNYPDHFIALINSILKT